MSASPSIPASRLRFPFGFARQPGRLPGARYRDPAGRVAGLNELSRAGSKYNARFLLASTSECYGDPLEHPQKESYWGHVNPIGPRSVYDESKRFAEALTMAYHRYQKVDTHIVRIFNTYGPRLQINDGRVISNFMKQALLGEDLTVYGDGSQTRSFCYVSDEVAGILALSKSDEHGPPISATRASSPFWSAPRRCSRSPDRAAGFVRAAAAGRSQAAPPRHQQSQTTAWVGAAHRSSHRPADVAGILQVCGSDQRRQGVRRIPAFGVRFS